MSLLPQPQPQPLTPEPVALDRLGRPCCTPPQREAILLATVRHAEEAAKAVVGRNGLEDLEAVVEGFLAAATKALTEHRREHGTQIILPPETPGYAGPSSANA